MRQGCPLSPGRWDTFPMTTGGKRRGVPSCHNRDLRIPECILCFYDVFIVEDHSQKKTIPGGKRAPAGGRQEAASVKGEDL